MQCINYLAPSAREVELIKLDHVMPLLQYLCSLPQDHEDRCLAQWEDKKACDILLDLPVPEEAAHAQDYVLMCLHPQNCGYRTLAVWYQIARQLAWLIERAD